LEQNHDDRDNQHSNQNGSENAEEKEDNQDVHPDHDEGFETFHFVDMKDGTFQPNNQRLDFLNRSHLMYDISFYEFVSDFEKTKIPPNFEIRDRDFRFNPRHPQHHTHYLRRRKHSAVPVIVGLPFPVKENNPELWHYLFLVLFKPFFSLEEMKLNDGETYVEKFNSWDINS